MIADYIRIELEDGRHLLLVQWTENGRVYARVVPWWFILTDDVDLFDPIVRDFLG